MKVLFLVCVLVTIRTFGQIKAEFKDCGTLCKCDFLRSATTVTCKGRNIREIPKNLPRNTTKLYLSGTSIKVVQANAFTSFQQISVIYFRDTDKEPCLLETLTPSCFDGLSNLKIIGIVRCHRLQSIEAGVFGKFQVLDTIQIYQSGLTSVPNFEYFQTLNENLNRFMLEIDLSNNQIENIMEHAFMSVKTHVLKLNNNKLIRIHDAAFYKAQIYNLQLDNNPTLIQLGENAFHKIEKLEKLDLSKTSIESLPGTGLENIVELRLKGTMTLRQFPPVIHFSKIEVAELYYPHHCCLFKNPEKQNPTEWKAYMEFQRRVQQECSTSPASLSTERQIMERIVTFSPRLKRNIFPGHFSSNNTLGFGPPAPISNASFHMKPEVNQGESFGSFLSDFNLSAKESTAFCGQVVKDYRQVICRPEPDAFNPCEDLMGYDWLRIFVWIILLAALFGNSVVLVVLIKSRGKMSVTKFLMCNLAFADLMMGIYLLLLASIDAHTLNEYFNYAVIWQNEGGCQAAGFLTVFSCELSIFTLTIITLERWYAISHAIHLTKRLRIRQAMIFMAFGWLYAIFMAHLPLVGISSYGHVSICLPMKVDDAADVAYVVGLLVVNGFAFICICGCYINMYCKVRGSQTNLRNNDATIAKRMAMLVFTNFACWAPIAFFGLTASAGLPLIDITNSKILLVFFYPLNSFANPYLYVIITKQFRKDLYILLGKYGFCTERANRYRVTFTSSNSRNSLANRNVVNGKTITISSKHFLSRPSNSESNCSTSTFIQHNSKHQSIRIRLPESGSECEKSDVGAVEMSTERRLRSPPPYVRSASEYVMFFPPPHKDSYSKYKFQQGRQIPIENGIAECALGHDRSQENLWVLSKSTDDQDRCDENPWVPQQTLDAYARDGRVLIGIQSVNEENLREFELQRLSDIKTVHLPHINGDISIDDGRFTDDECDDDNVQQTLLKHCTLRESPVSTIDRKCPSDSALTSLDVSDNGVAGLCTSRSSSNIDDVDFNKIVFNRKPST